MARPRTSLALSPGSPSGLAAAISASSTWLGHTASTTNDRPKQPTPAIAVSTYAWLSQAKLPKSSETSEVWDGTAIPTGPVSIARQSATKPAMMGTAVSEREIQKLCEARTESIHGASDCQEIPC